MTSTKLLVATLLLGAAAYAPAASAGRFYLSTDRVFAPGQQPEVKLEANGVGSLDVRLYRIEDPAAWFDSQADLHRPQVDNEEPRPAVIPLLRRGARIGMRELLKETRHMFNEAGRSALRTGLPRVHQKAAEGPDSVSTRTVLPPLSEYPLLEAWRYDLPDRYGWVYDVMPIPVSQPGTYLVEATADQQVAYAVVLVTDVALITKQSSEKLLVWAVHPATGEPQADARVRLSSRGAVVERKETDRNGLAVFETALMNSAVIYATHGASFTVVDPRFYSANLPEPRVYLFTERPVYRPGQTVFFKGWARQIEDERYEVPTSGAPVAVEIRDPKGNVFTEQSHKLSARGAFDGKLELPPEPTMGTWQIVATLDGKRYAGQFKVMAYVKPEVKLDVRLAEPYLRSGDAVSGEIEGKYFFGAPYPDATVKITVTRTRFYVPWYVDADYRWYYSEAEYRNTSRDVVQEIECKLDDDGRCTFEFQTKADSEDFTYVVEATTQGPTGRTVTGSTTATVTIGEFRLAIDQAKLVTRPGQRQTLTVRAETYGRRPVRTDVTVTVRGRHVTSDGQPETIELSRTTKATDADGKIQLDVDASRGGYYEVIAEAIDDKGKKITQETFLFVSESGGDLPFAPDDVEIVTDKRSYFIGDTALVLVLAPAPEARLLLTVEGGDLYRYEVKKTVGHATLFEVEIGERQSPNFFVGATCITGGRLYSRQRSIVVPPREKLLTIEVSPDRPEAKPGDEVTFTVTATDFRGKPVEGAEVALGVVDEAIYAISPDIAVALEGFFHHRKRNDVRTADSLSFRIFGTSRSLGDTVAGRVMDRPWAHGSMKPQLDDDRKVFKDTAGWFPSLVTDGQGRAKATVALPDNLTSWRATARVMSSETFVGMGKGNVRAKKPVIVRVALPSRLTEGDTASGSIVVQNLSGKDGEFDVKFTAEPVSPAGDPSPPELELTFAEGVTLPGKLAVKNGRSAKLPFSYVVRGSGALKLTARASLGGLKDGVETRVEVAEWAAIERIARSGRTGPDALTVSHTLKLPPGAVAEQAVVEVSVMSSGLDAVRSALPYLVDYPYGCVEQTMSRFLPLIAVRGAMKRLDLQVPLHPSRVDSGADVDALIGLGVDRLLQMQRDDGGFGWWGEDRAVDLWMTSYVVEGLGRAEQLGATLDKPRMKKAVDALKRALAGHKVGLPERAFAIYALAQHGVFERTMLGAVAKELTARPGGAPVTSLAYSSIAARLMGDAETAGRLEAALAARAHRTNDAAWFGGTADTPLSWDSRVTEPEQHPVEATSLAILALAASKAPEHKSLLDKSTSWLLLQLRDGRFGSTRQTAYAVRALSTQLSAANPGAGASFTVSVNGVAAPGQTVEAGVARKALLVRPQVKLSGGDVVLEVTQAGAGTFFHVASVRVPVKANKIAAKSTGRLSIERRFFPLSGSAGAYQKRGASSSFGVGDTVLVELVIRAPQSLKHVLVEDLRPSGLSAVHRDSGMQVRGVDLRRGFSHREHRDDRTAFFIGRLPSGTTTLYYLARAGLAGAYPALPARAEAMYVPQSFWASSTSGAVTVR